ncbi:hypothetical protein ACWD4O_26050 [Streptomyces sp. NPDC002623]
MSTSTRPRPPVGTRPPVPPRVARRPGPGPVPAGVLDTARLPRDAGRGRGRRAGGRRLSPAAAGTLHGVEADPAAIARVLLREKRVIVVGDAVRRPARNARDRVKRRVLREHFAERSTTGRRGRSVTVYERVR